MERQLPIPTCRIAIFYDGTYVTCAQRHYYHERKIGWMDLSSLRFAIEAEVGRNLPGDRDCRVVYSAWFQGVFAAEDATDSQLRLDRRLYHDLLRASIEPKFEPNSPSTKREKGVDVALAIDATKRVLAGSVDVVVLVTGDGDFVPLARAVAKEGVLAMAVYFEYDGPDGKSFINERLRAACAFHWSVTDDTTSGRNLPPLFRKAGGM